MVKIKVTILSNLGVFSGFMKITNSEEVTVEEAHRFIDEIVSVGGHLKHIGLETDAGTVLSIPENVIQNSLLEFEVVE